MNKIDKPVVILNESIHRDGLDILDASCSVFVESDLGIASGLICEAEGIIVRASGQFMQTHLSKAGALKVVGRYGVGVDNIDVSSCTKRKIPVIFTPGSNSRSVAELVIGQMLSLLRNAKQQDLAIRNGNWNSRNNIAGSEAGAMTLGLIGLGRIGCEVASIARRGFSMEVYYFDLRRNIEAETMYGIQFVSLDELLSLSDVVSLHLPSNAQTHHMISASEFAKMKPGAFLINMSRGGLVDEVALISALESKRLSGAALDVFEHEPIEIDSPLLNIESLLLTPHSAGLTDEATRRMSISLANDVVAVLEERKPTHVFNGLDIGGL
jgi:D-3-phosphoglycerate dehydrogenase